MKTIRVTHDDGSVTQTNFMLDDVIDLFEQKGINTPENEDLIKRLAIQKIEYGRTVLMQLLSKPACEKLDNKLIQLINGLGGSARRISWK